MPTVLTWHEIAIRLALAFVAGGLIGLDRGERGNAAGLRTTMLVCLAAAVAMIQTNLLLNTAGKPSDSFVMLDLMRLPLGILTGMGFIGGGAILRRGNILQGVTTAATLWFVTVMGLCFGGGQIALGVASFALAVVVLAGLRWFDSHMKHERHAIVQLTLAPDQPSEEEIISAIQRAGFTVSLVAVTYSAQDEQRRLKFNLEWSASTDTIQLPAFLKQLADDERISEADWQTV
jgi:putative Mg2+ transporter-C (MgtC) family protein